MCVHLESTHMYRILAVPFSRFFRVTFDYPRLSLCHVKNYWICYIRYIFLLRCDDHLKMEDTKFSWSDGRVMDSLLVISISISIFSIDYLLFSLISIREERFIKYFSVLENCFLRFYFRFYSYHLPDIFFENRKEKIIRMYVFSKCFSIWLENSRNASSIILKRQFDMSVLWKMQIRILLGVLVLCSLDKFWKYYFSPLNEFLKVDFLPSSETEILQGHELRNLYDNEWKSLYGFCSMEILSPITLSV